MDLTGFTLPKTHLPQALHRTYTRIVPQRNIQTVDRCTHLTAVATVLNDEIHAGNGVFNKDLKAEANTSYEAGAKNNSGKKLVFAEIAFL
jgi:hypothetical protein